MGLVSGIVVYVLIWWTALFAVLPWGNAPSAQPGFGHAPGAPAHPRLKLKFIATTVVSAVLWLAIYIFMKMNLISFHDIAASMMRQDGFQ